MTAQKNWIIHKALERRDSFKRCEVVLVFETRVVLHYINLAGCCCLATTSPEEVAIIIVKRMHFLLTQSYYFFSKAEAKPESGFLLVNWKPQPRSSK